MLLKDIETILQSGLSKTMQGSYNRRAPAKESVPPIIKSRHLLKTYIANNPSDQKAWKLLSLAEEALLNYCNAIEWLQKYISAGHTDKKDLKKLYLLKEAQHEWRDLKMTPEQLFELTSHLNEVLSQRDCSHTLENTRKWLIDKFGKNKTTQLCKALQNKGGFCDCEVIANICH